MSAVFRYNSDESRVEGRLIRATVVFTHRVAQSGPVS